MCCGEVIGPLERVYRNINYTEFCALVVLENISVLGMLDLSLKVIGVIFNGRALLTKL